MAVDTLDHPAEYRDKPPQQTETRSDRPATRFPTALRVPRKVRFVRQFRQQLDGNTVNTFIQVIRCRWVSSVARRISRNRVRQVPIRATGNAEIRLRI